VPRLVAQSKRLLRDVVLQENMSPEDTPLEVLLNGLRFTDPVEDFVKAGSVETWQWINLTGDAHPMHTHLVTFQVLDRQAFDTEAYGAAWQAFLDSGRNNSFKPRVSEYVVGPTLPPAPEELGFKDTVKAYPEYVTRVRARFDLPRNATLKVIDDHETYGKWVYHCHILEHEENDMMRPFEVVP
jgi:spore coat protein A